MRSMGNESSPSRQRAGMHKALNGKNTTVKALATAIGRNI